MLLRGVAVVLIVLALAPVARAAPEITPPVDPRTMTPLPAGSPDPLRVFVMTMGPGDHPFFRFGHNAIWIRDQVGLTDKVYNFGTFRFDSPRLIFDFLGGRLNYWLSVSTLPRVIADYSHENRDIAVQELALSPEQKAELRTALDVNARPENRLYKYDYFLDNCSTRVRDAVDRVTGGEVQAPARQPGRMTLRQHALRMTAQPFWLYLALDVVLGPKVDQPIDRWTEMFLPGELARGLDAADDHVTRTGGGALVITEDGRPVTPPPQPVQPLVSGRAQLFRADRPAPLEWPPARGRAFALYGIVFALVVFAIGWAGRWRRAARVALGILTTLWGLAVGFIGCFLVYVWAFTDHVVAHRNQNILLCAPWAIALFVLGIGVAMGRPGATRKAFALSMAALAAALLACLLKVGIVAHQENGALIAFFLPAWVGITAGLLLLRYATALGTTKFGTSRL
jgi:hypothetical protein